MEEVAAESTPTRKRRKVVTKPKGAVVPAKTDEEKQEAQKKVEKTKLAQERRKQLNEAADVFMACLEPSFAVDWRQTAEEQKVKDFGVFLLGVLNRLSKMVDYTESDIEPEWEQGEIGYNEQLYCEYCKKEIELTKTTHLRQKFCSNLCAKRQKDSNTTGIIFPNDNPGPTEEALEEKQWQREAKREGIING